MKVRYQLVVATMVVALMISCFVAGRQYQAVAATAGGARILDRIVGALGGESGAGAAGVEDVSLQPLESFQEVLNHLRQQYYSPLKDETKLTHSAIRGMLAALRESPYEDRYTRFLAPDEYRSFLDENEGHFGGIGAEIGVREASTPEMEETPAPSKELTCPACGADLSKVKPYDIVVVAPLPDSPAERAGLRSGDRIEEVDGTPTKGLGLGGTVQKIKGRAGTTVQLLIGREGEEKPLEVKIVRGVIQIRSVTHQMLPDDIGYLRITTFNESTPDLAKKAMHSLRADGMKGLLLDLRGNTGGELESCVEAASQFLGKGPVVYIEERGKPRRVRNAVNGGERISVPMVVLINGGSASASEILAGALQDNDLGILMGEKTFGKGMVQTVFPLRDGSALALTTARYLTPKLRDIDKKGISPDKEVKQADTKGPVPPLSENDTQATAALKYLREQIARPLRAAA
jgi:carboxyl-terminal processing protease